MNLEPLKSDDPLLRQACESVSKRALRTNALQAEIDGLLDFVYGKNNKGEKRNKRKPMTVGLSANQVGIMKQISIVDVAIGRKKFNEVLVLINPEITWRSKTLVGFDEACVNIPEVWGYTRNRAKRVKVSALTRSGQEIHLDLKGSSAVLLQHEADHLNGKLFIDHLEDPMRACHVKDEELPEYKKSRKKNYTSWGKFIDVSDLARK